MVKLDFGWIDFFFLIVFIFITMIGVSLVLPSNSGSILNVPHFIG